MVLIELISPKQNDRRKAVRVSDRLWVSAGGEKPPEVAWSPVNIDPDAEADVWIRVVGDTVEIDARGDGVPDFILTVSDFKRRFPLIDLGSLQT